jgi:hypothetical protein
MARCLFCKEWARVNARWHESCLHEFEQNMERRGMLRRIMGSVMRSAIASMAFVLGLLPTAGSPARVPAVNAHSAPARRVPRRLGSESAEQAASRQHAGNGHNAQP